MPCTGALFQDTRIRAASVIPYGHGIFPSERLADFTGSAFETPTTTDGRESELTTIPHIELRTQSPSGESRRAYHEQPDSLEGSPSARREGQTQPVVCLRLPRFTPL
jgi:hypothetical protein